MLFGRKQERSVVPVTRHHFETIIVTEDKTELVRKVVQVRRMSSVTEVFVTTQSGYDTRWWITTTEPSPDLDWLGVPWPHVRPLVRKAPSRGSYAKTPRGTWRVGMRLVPVANEGLERAKLINYRGIAGIGIWSRSDDLMMGFALEVATPNDGTVICQRSLLNTAADIGVRAEVANDPGFAVLTERLSRLDIAPK
jgi:hypothetical protein